VQKGVDKVKKHVWFYLALAVGLFALAPAAKATVLTPGMGAVAPDALPVGCFGSLGCPTTLLADTGAEAFSTPSITGTVEEIVLLDSAPNTVCPTGGCLDFEIQVLVNSGPDSIGRVTAGDFTGFAVDAGFDSLFTSIGLNSTSGVNLPPSTVDRLTADVVGFNFATGITVGNSSDILEIETDAHGYKAGTIGLIDAVPTGVSGFAPTVPEPTTLSILGIGLLSLLGLRKKSNA